MESYLEVLNFFLIYFHHLFTINELFPCAKNLTSEVLIIYPVKQTRASYVVLMAKT